jgi:hypothetical protein
MAYPVLGARKGGKAFHIQPQPTFRDEKPFSITVGKTAGGCFCAWLAATAPACKETEYLHRCINRPDVVAVRLRHALSRTSFFLYQYPARCHFLPVLLRAIAVIAHELILTFAAITGYCAGVTRIRSLA